MTDSSSNRPRSARLQRSMRSMSSEHHCLTSRHAEDAVPLQVSLKRHLVATLCRLVGWPLLADSRRFVAWPLVAGHE